MIALRLERKKKVKVWKDYHLREISEIISHQRIKKKTFYLWEAKMWEHFLPKRGKATSPGISIPLLFQLSHIIALISGICCSYSQERV